MNWTPNFKFEAMNWIGSKVYTHYYWIFPQNGYNGNDILGYFDIKKIIVLVPWIMIFVKDTLLYICMPVQKPKSLIM
jgi:hypothetical protein